MPGHKPLQSERPETYHMPIDPLQSKGRRWTDADLANGTQDEDDTVRVKGPVSGSGAGLSAGEGSPREDEETLMGTWHYP